MSAARQSAWARIIASELRRAERRSFRAWHHGSPNRDVLDAPNPPFRDGRYHRAGGRPTWYGSSTEAGAWAEFVRSLPEGADASEFQRRIGRVNVELVALDLTRPDLQRRLSLKRGDLVADNLAVCQQLADVAADAGFEALIAPSAALETETTLAVFGAAIRAGARDVADLGVRSPPVSAR